MRQPETLRNLTNNIKHRYYGLTDANDGNCGKLKCAPVQNNYWSIRLNIAAALIYRRIFRAGIMSVELSFSGTENSRANIWRVKFFIAGSHIGYHYPWILVLLHEPLIHRKNLTGKIQFCSDLYSTRDRWTKRYYSIQSSREKKIEF